MKASRAPLRRSILGDESFDGIEGSGKRGAALGSLGTIQPIDDGMAIKVGQAKICRPRRGSIVRAAVIEGDISAVQVVGNIE
ncbi:hypothetical protein CARN8_640001 [mine drainage metagenome]|uniref:Uncharacterized protein n=1 Tax=mine drainage metagenome TaxID=410659 RepID=A0A3P3ZR53_9ZZZZ